MIRRGLLTMLFVVILLPVLVVLYQSSSTLMTQKRMTTETSGRYVRALAAYAADRWNDRRADRIDSFLSILYDHGYETLISKKETSSNVMPVENGKFVPGMVAFIAYPGRVLAHSKGASILQQIFVRSASTGLVMREEHITGSFITDDDDITYVACIMPTRSQGVWAVSAVTMMSWMGQNDFDMIKLSIAGSVGMLICLSGLMMLRGSVIGPLRRLASLVDGLKWGEELPTDEDRGLLTFDIGIDEIASLRSAIRGLAERMIEKNELERRYVGDIIKAQEEERARIAQDIHDGPIQIAAGLIQKLQIAEITSERIDEETRHLLNDTEEMAEGLVDDLRDICDSLVPPWISLGIVSSIEEAAARLSRQHDISITVNASEEIEADTRASLAIFRIFQEAVSNAVRHGRASSVEVAITRDGDALEVVIRDDGCGFDIEDRSPEELMREGRRGLNGMKQRADLLGGRCSVSSSEGAGTQIDIHIPCRR